MAKREILIHKEKFEDGLIIEIYETKSIYKSSQNTKKAAEVIRKSESKSVLNVQGLDIDSPLTR